MFTAIEKSNYAPSDITGRNEISTIREGIADCDLYAMFGCIKMDEGGNLRLTTVDDGTDEGYNIKGEDANGSELERLFKKQGGRVKKFRVKADIAERERRVAIMSERFLDGLNLFDDGDDMVDGDGTVAPYDEE